MFRVDDSGNTVVDGAKFKVNNGLDDSHVSNSAAFQAKKLGHQHALNYNQPSGTAVVAATVEIHIVEGTTGNLDEVQAVITGLIATGGDRTVTIDIHKSSGGAAFATVLSSTLVFTSASTLRTAVAAALDSTKVALVAGDILRFVITVAGAVGNQAQGLHISARVTEAFVA